MSYSIGQGSSVIACCRQCEYEVTDLRLGTTAFNDRPAVDHVVAYAADRLIVVDREVPDETDPPSVVRDDDLRIIADPMSHSHWDCPRCGTPSLAFKLIGHWRSD